MPGTVLDAGCTAGNKTDNLTSWVGETDCTNELVIASNGLLLLGSSVRSEMPKSALSTVNESQVSVSAAETCKRVCLIKIFHARKSVLINYFKHIQGRANIYRVHSCM